MARALVEIPEGRGSRSRIIDHYGSYIAGLTGRLSCILSISAHFERHENLRESVEQQKLLA